MDRTTIAAMVIALALFAVITTARGPPSWTNNMDKNGTWAPPVQMSNHSGGNGTGPSNKTAPGQQFKQTARIRLRDCVQNASVGECVAQMRARNRERITNKLMSKCGDLPKGQDKCREHVQSLSKCWGTPPGLQRAECARTRLGVRNRSQVREQMENCAGNSSCAQEVRQRVYNYATFRFQGLSERAEDMLQRGVSAETVDTFVQDLQDLIDSFTAAEELEEKKAILLDIRELWKDFVESAKEEV